MNRFERTLRHQALASLHHLAEEAGSNWWKDLLTLWSPSGSNEDHGLRLAVRKNYLNFYLRGQSVARVNFTSAHEPYVSTHVKYAFGGEEVAQDYARLRGTDIRHPITGAMVSYEGPATLRQWMEQADRYKGPEKTCVDELVAANPAVIDVEMGLPAFGGQKTAQRIDCVALERDGDVISIVFWEAKMIDDARLRSESVPKVIGQLKIYRDYLEDVDRAQNVREAYQTVCRLLSDMHRMAARFRDLPPLDPLVVAAAGGHMPLKVDPVPRLVIFGGDKYHKKSNWDCHRDRLRAEAIPCLVLADEQYRLRHPEAGS